MIFSEFFSDQPSIKKMIAARPKVEAIFIGRVFREGPGDPSADGKSSLSSEFFNEIGSADPIS